MFKTFTKIFSMLIIGILMNPSFTGCGSSSNSTNPTPTPTPTPPVETVKLVSVQVSPADVYVLVGENEQFAATAVFSDGSTKDVTSNATWETSDKSIAAINENGTATGISVGSVELAATYTDNGIEETGAAHLDVLATPPTFESLSIDGSDVVTVGHTAHMVAIATLSDGTTYIVNDKVNWTSSDTATATIDATGTVTGVAVGNVTLIATAKTDSSITATHSLEVIEAAVTLTSIQIERGYNPSTPQPITTLDVPITTEVYVTAWGIYSDGTRKYINTDTVWWSDEQQIASINYLDSTNIYGRDLGTAMIGARYEGLTASIEVMVVNNGSTLTGIMLKTDDGTDVTGGTLDTIPAGFKTWVTAYGTYSDGTTGVNINRYVAYSSDEPDVAYVNDVIDSNIHGQSNGSAVITAKWQGVSASVTAPVTGLTSIVIKTSEGNPIDIDNPLTILTGPLNKAYITAHGNYEDGQERYINTIVFWKSDDKDIASISLLQNASWVRGINAGTTQVSAKLVGVEGRATVIVIDE